MGRHHISWAAARVSGASHGARCVRMWGCVMPGWCRCTHKQALDETALAFVGLAHLQKLSILVDRSPWLSPPPVPPYPTPVRRSVNPWHPNHLRPVWVQGPNPAHCSLGPVSVVGGKENRCCWQWCLRHTGDPRGSKAGQGAGCVPGEWSECRRCGVPSEWLESKVCCGWLAGSTNALLILPQ